MSNQSDYSLIDILVFLSVKCGLTLNGPWRTDTHWPERHPWPKGRVPLYVLTAQVCANKAVLRLRSQKSATTKNPAAVKLNNTIKHNLGHVSI